VPIWSVDFNTLVGAKGAPHFAVLAKIFQDGVVQRPSTITGAKYKQVSAAYFNAVNSVVCGLDHSFCDRDQASQGLRSRRRAE